MHTPSGLAVRVAQLQAELMRVTRKRLDHHGIKLHYRQVQALRLLRVCGAMSAGELARSLGHDSGGMTRLLDRLEERGLLERHADPSDRRSLCIRPTAAGLALGERLAAIGDEVLAQALRGFSVPEQRSLLDCLERMLAALREAH